MTFVSVELLLSSFPRLEQRKSPESSTRRHRTTGPLILQILLWRCTLRGAFFPMCMLSLQLMNSVHTPGLYPFPGSLWLHALSLSTGYSQIKHKVHQSVTPHVLTMIVIALYLLSHPYGSSAALLTQRSSTSVMCLLSLILEPLQGWPPSPRPTLTSLSPPRRFP